MAAKISTCGKYRYWLSRPARIKSPGKGTALFIMLNPSTADAELDDPTIRRCRGFADYWDCNGVTVANLYALRSTDPKGLWRSDDPVGPANPRVSGCCVCLGTTKHGAPRHPLYIKADQPLIEFSGVAT